MTNQEQITLFDIDNEPIKVVFKSKYQKWKYENNYQKADYLSDIRCKNCKYLIQRKLSKNYYKCQLLGESSSPATDVRLSNVCRNFEFEEGE